MFDDERKKLYAQYHDATVKIVLLSLLDLATSVRAKEPEAKYVYITASDQPSGGYSSSAITAADGEELADGLEELDLDDTATLGNLHDDEAATDAWKSLVEDNPTEDVQGEYRIDIDKVLERITPADFAPQRVEVLHGRDPDSACDIVVYIDGEPVGTDYIGNVDPGAGHVLADWDASTDEIAENTTLTPAFRDELVEWRNANRDSSFIIKRS